MTGVAPRLEEPSAGAEAGDGGPDLLHDDGSGRCEHRLLGAHQIAAQGGPVRRILASTRASAPAAESPARIAES